MSHLRVTPLSDVVVFLFFFHSCFSLQKLFFCFLGASPDWILVVVVVVSNVIIQQGVYDCATTRAKSPGSRTPGGSGTQSPRRATTVDHRRPRKFSKKTKNPKLREIRRFPQKALAQHELSCEPCLAHVPQKKPRSRKNSSVCPTCRWIKKADKRLHPPTYHYTQQPEEACTPCRPTSA